MELADGATPQQRCGADQGGCDDGEIERIALDTPGIIRVAAFAGFSGATRTQAGNAAALFPVFDEPETVRSVQLYGTDPTYVGRAVEILCDEFGVAHVDLNFGCPVPKVTRKGGGAALPWKTA